jgi:hypothetical protein
MILPVTGFAALAGLRRRGRVIQMLAVLDVRAQPGALASSICGRAHGLLGGASTSLDPDEQSSLE